MVASVAAATRVYFAWKKHHRETQLLLDEEYSRVDNLRLYTRREVIEAFSSSLSDVRHLHLQLEPLERLRKEFDLLFDKLDVVTYVRGLHEALLQCERYRQRVRRVQLIRAVVAVAAIVVGASAAAPLANRIVTDNFQYATINWIALLVTVELVCGFIGLVLFERRIRSSFRRLTAITGDED